MTQLLKRSPHYGQHVAHGATAMFDFAGWEMPEHFSSMADEVKACRNAAVLFDGHAMGEVAVRGREAHRAVQRLCANDIKAEPGRCFYTSLLTEDGGIFDDLVVLCLAPDHFLLTVAAFNVHKSPTWVHRHIEDLDAYTCDHSAGVTCLEVQGPKAREILARVADADLSNQALSYFRFIETRIAGIACLIARLGVTGELGYEIFYDPGYAWQMYDALYQAGRESGLQLCGNRTVGMFRLEKVYHIYTRDIDETTNPLEAGLDRWVKFDKGDFIGRDALLRVRDQGVTRRLVGLRVEGGPAAVAPRTPLAIDGEQVGTATFGAHSPTLDRTIALGYVPPQVAAPGTRLQILASSGNLDAEVVQIPFFDPRGERIRV